MLTNSAHRHYHDLTNMSSTTMKSDQIDFVVFRIYAVIPKNNGGSTITMIGELLLISRLTQKVSALSDYLLLQALLNYLLYDIHFLDHLDCGHYDYTTPVGKLSTRQAEHCLA